MFLSMRGLQGARVTVRKGLAIMDSEIAGGAHLILRCAPSSVSLPGATPHSPCFPHTVSPSLSCTYTPWILYMPCPCASGSLTRMPGLARRTSLVIAAQRRSPVQRGDGPSRLPFSCYPSRATGNAGFSLFRLFFSRTSFPAFFMCRCRVLHRSRPAPKVGDQNARARRPSPHQKSAFLHHLGRQH